MKLSHDDQGPFLLLALDELGDVGKWLIDRGVPFREDEGASTSCAGPVVGVLRFEPDVDVVGLQAVLDQWPGSSPPG